MAVAHSQKPALLTVADLPEALQNHVEGCRETLDLWPYLQRYGALPPSPLHEQLEEYVRQLPRRPGRRVRDKRAERTVEETGANVRRVLREGGFWVPAQISRTQVNRLLASIERGDTGKDRTSIIRGHFSGFLDFLVERGVLESNPLERRGKPKHWEAYEELIRHGADREGNGAIGRERSIVWGFVKDLDLLNPGEWIPGYVRLWLWTLHRDGGRQPDLHDARDRNEKTGGKPAFDRRTAGGYLSSLRRYSAFCAKTERREDPLAAVDLAYCLDFPGDGRLRSAKPAASPILDACDRFHDGLKAQHPSETTYPAQVKQRVVRAIRECGLSTVEHFRQGVLQFWLSVTLQRLSPNVRYNLLSSLRLFSRFLDPLVGQEVLADIGEDRRKQKETKPPPEAWVFHNAYHKVTDAPTYHKPEGILLRYGKKYGLTWKNEQERRAKVALISWRINQVEKYKEACGVRPVYPVIGRPELLNELFGFWSTWLNDAEIRRRWNQFPPIVWVAMAGLRDAKAIPRGRNGLARIKHRRWQAIGEGAPRRIKAGLSGRAIAVGRKFREEKDCTEEECWIWWSKVLDGEGRKKLAPDHPRAVSLKTIKSDIRQYVKKEREQEHRDTRGCFSTGYKPSATKPAKDVLTAQERADPAGALERLTADPIWRVHVRFARWRDDKKLTAGQILDRWYNDVSEDEKIEEWPNWSPDELPANRGARDRSRTRIWRFVPSGRKIRELERLVSEVEQADRGNGNAETPPPQIVPSGADQAVGADRGEGSSTPPPSGQAVKQELDPSDPIDAEVIRTLDSAGVATAGLELSVSEKRNLILANWRSAPHSMSPANLRDELAARFPSIAIDQRTKTDGASKALTYAKRGESLLKNLKS